MSSSEPLHARSRPDVLWTRVNSEEATPGVLTPLHWDFYEYHCERGLRLGMFDRGVYSWAEVEPPESVDEKWSALFFGRVAINVDALRACYDRIPGSSGADFEQSMLGSVRPDVGGRPTVRRHPVIRLKSERLKARIPDRIVSTFRDFDAWWRVSVTPGALVDAAAAPQRWLGARVKLEEGMRVHSGATHLTVDAFTTLARICATVDRLDLLNDLTGGYGDTEDDRVSAELWEVAHGRADLDAFVLAHGYRGNREGDLAAHVWREDPTVLAPTLDALARMGEESGPRTTGERRRAERERAEQAVLDVLDDTRRDDARRVLNELGRFTTLREMGKSTFLRAVDVGRAASRAMGRHLADAGALDDPEDVFFLVGDELTPALVPDARERVEYRRARRAEYEALEVPQTWVGNPVPVAVAPAGQAHAGERRSTMAGLGVSGGVVEGRARVVADPAAGEPIEPGEILVCHTTDPSWVGYFLVAGGLAIDIGGPLSHGAIVDRELGVPCVIGTGTGTADVATGDLLRVSRGEERCRRSAP